MSKLFIPLLAVLSVNVFGKTLEGRIGAGMTVMDFNRSAALSAKFHPSRYLNIVGLVGFDTDPSRNSSLFGCQIHRNFSIEENLNFFLGVGLYAISDRGGASESANASGIEADGLMGAEFFFPGVPNLGIQFQTGVGVKTLRRLSVKVLGDSFAGVGFHYYL